MEILRQSSDILEALSANWKCGLLSLEEWLESDSSDSRTLQAVEDSQTFEKPNRLPFGVSPRGAELYVAEWLKWMDFEKIEVSPARRDGGYDVAADDLLVQVKNWNRDWVGVAPIRELYGVAQLAGKRSALFTKGWLSEDAAEFATEAGISVFQFSAEEAILNPVNEHAVRLLADQMSKKVFKLFCVLTDAENKAALMFIYAYFAALEICKDFFDLPFNEAVQKIKAITEATVGTMDDARYSNIEALKGLDRQGMTKSCLEALGRSNEIIAIHKALGNFISESQASIDLAIEAIRDAVT